MNNSRDPPENNRALSSDTFDLRGYAASARPDARAAANPAAWNYHDPGVLGAVQSMERRLNFLSEFVYSQAIRGFSARLTAAQIQQLENDVLVKYIESDGVATINAQTLPWGIDKANADTSSTLAGNGSGAITNVHAYVVDTGIDISHSDLNVVGHVNFASGPNTDCNGHGTHVAGTIAAEDNTADVVGMAPGTALHDVKVLGCGGSRSWSNVVAAIDWVKANAVKPAVANMSLGGGANKPVDDAVKNLADSGVLVAVAAGNDGANACSYSPARAGTNSGVVTIAATDSAEKEASWSNYGSCVDIWAPGVSILSTKKGGGTTTMSGTSMATPHLAGGAALYLSTHTGAAPSTVESALKAAATTTVNTSKDGRTITRLNVYTF